VLLRPGFGTALSTEGTDVVVLCGSTLASLQEESDSVLYELQQIDDGLHADAMAAVFSRIVGHFAATVVMCGRTFVVTDHLGFIPVFRSGKSEQFIAGTNLLDVARVRESELDNTSLVEFIGDGFITSPHTVFAGIERQWPALVSEIGSHVQASPYWMPPTPTRSDVGEVAEALHQTLTGIFRILGERTTSVTLTYSGGEDSRIVGSYAAREGIDVRGIIFLDASNREYRHARLAAKLSGVQLEKRSREADHDSSRLLKRLEVCGPGVDLLHAHAHDMIRPGVDATPVLDGFLASLLKADMAPHTQSVRRTIPVGLSRIKDSVDTSLSTLPPVGASEIDIEIHERRRRKTARLEYLPVTSREEWKLHWPASDYYAFGWFDFNQKSYPSLSPLVLQPMVDLCASVYPADRLNRVLFKAAFARHLSMAAWIPRTEGEVLALSPRLDLVVAAWNKVWYKVGERIRTRNNGPWQNNATRRTAAYVALEQCEPSVVSEIRAMLSGSGHASTDSWPVVHRLAQVAEAVVLIECSVR
jgi:hypothetical protein